MAQLCLCKPVLRKLFTTIRHILAPEDAKCQQFFRSQFRIKNRIKISTLRLRQFIHIPGLHQIFDSYYRRPHTSKLYGQTLRSQDTVALMSQNHEFSKCYRCFRPSRQCYCSSLSPINTGIRFIFLMHPKEAYHQKTGTGRLAALSLTGSEIIIGTDFTHNQRLNTIINTKNEFSDCFPVVLYPGDRSSRANSPEFATLVSGKKLIVIVIDATWFFARKMLSLSTNLHTVPLVSFGGSYRSRFDFKKQPAPECLSTIESCYYLIEEFKEAGLVHKKTDAAPLLSVFRKMVDFQLQCEQRRHEDLAATLYPDLFQRQI